MGVGCIQRPGIEAIHLKAWMLCDAAYTLVLHQLLQWLEIVSFRAAPAIPSICFRSTIPTLAPIDKNVIVIIDNICVLI